MGKEGATFSGSEAGVKNGVTVLGTGCSNAFLDSMICSNCLRTAAWASVLTYEGCALFSKGLDSLGFPNIAKPIFLTKPGVTSSLGNSPKRCFSLLFLRNSLISSTSSRMGIDNAEDED